MANLKDSLELIMKIDGVIAASVVDSSSGFMLGAGGKEKLDLEYASAANTEMFHAKQKIMDVLGIHELIEDFLITMETQYHVLMPAHHLKGVFIYAVFSKNGATLAMARRQLHDITKQLDI